MIITFNISFDIGWLKFYSMDNTIASSLSELSNFGRKLCNFKQVEKFCISQGCAVTFLRCGGQVYSVRCLQDSVYQQL